MRQFLLFFVLTFSFCTSTIHSQMLEATLLEIKFADDAEPQNLLKADSGFYFTAEDNIHGRELWHSDGTADGTKLVKDIWVGAGNAMPNGFELLNGILYFSASDGINGYKIWRSDATESGTYMVSMADYTSGTEDYFGKHLIAFNDKIYFNGYNAASGNELWVSDGSEAGTFLFKDIDDRPDQNGYPSNFYVFNNSLFFSATDELHERELWKSDGTIAGTQLLKDINIYGNAVINEMQYLVLNNEFYFFVQDGITGYELWKSDGSTEGTALVKDINNGLLIFDFEGTVLNDQIIFMANDGTNGWEPWRSDGTEAGTFMLKNIHPTYNSLNGFGPQSFATLNDNVFFIADDSVHGPEIWKTDGTTTGTQLFKDVGSTNFYASTTGLVNLNNALWFIENDDLTNPPGLWKSNGTLAGTVKVNAEISGGNLEDGIAFGTDIIFSADIEQYGFELWKSNGTDIGTTLLKDLNHPGHTFPDQLTDIEGNMYFTCQSISGFKAVCMSDGTPEGSVQLKDLIASSDGVNFKSHNGILYFIATDRTHGLELWRSDGTEIGTYMVKDIWPGSNDGIDEYSVGSGIHILDNILYFDANDGVHGGELWRSDGTEQGTYMVKNIWLGGLPGGTGTQYASSAPRQLTIFNGNLYFTARDDDAMFSFWKSDGTESGTVEVMDFDGGINRIRVINGKLLLYAATAQGGEYGLYDLWVSDGTSAGTTVLKSFGSFSSGGNEMVAVMNDELYFATTELYVTGDDTTGRHAIFKSDGTIAGTVPIYKAIDHPLPNVHLQDIFACGDKVFFGVKPDGGPLDNTTEIWRTDGTSTGLVQVMEDMATFTSYGSMTCINNNLFFGDYGGAPISTIWVTNGSANGTAELNIDVKNGQNLVWGSGIGVIGTAGGKLYFEATTTESGSELYIADPKTITAGGVLTDVENDGVVDIVDECPETPAGEEVDEEGCAESQKDDDEDGITNDKDLCPNTIMGETVDAQGCSQNQLGDDDNDNVVNGADQCPDTPIGQSVDANGCAASQLDDDDDGISNDQDMCPQSPVGSTVGATGCPFEFELASDNFKIKTIGETCIDKANGQLTIESDTSHGFTATIAGTNYSFDNSLTISDLSAGDYYLCITSATYPDYEQCFQVRVAASEQISGKSTTIQDSRTGKITETVEIDLGTAPYQVVVNGIKVLTTSSKLFSLEVNSGDFLTVASKLPCEGSYEKQIEVSDQVKVYPNPSSDQVTISISDKSSNTIEVEVYTIDQQLILEKQFLSEGGNIVIPIREFSAGIYFIKVKSEEEIILKIIKI